MQSNFKFETCENDDVVYVQDLVAKLYSEDASVKDVRPDVTLTHNHFREHPDKGRLVVMRNGHQVGGYAIIVFFWSNEYGSNIIEIDELLIGEKWRGQGVGAAFFDWLRSEFATTSKGWTLQVSHHNERAERLYTKLGFKLSRNKHMINVFE